jgi:hypothetical protein
VGKSQPLATPAASVTLDANGNGVTSLGPTRVREHWQVTSASVKTGQLASAITNDANCIISIGPTIATSTFVSQSITGSSGDTCGLGGWDITPGYSVWAQWLAGDPGAVATLTLLANYSIGPPE